MTVGRAFILRLLRYNQRRLNSVLTQTQPLTARSNRRLARTALVVAAIGALWFILFRQLSNEWSINEQYSYGWFVPFFALFLFWLRWQDRPDPEIRSRRTRAANNRRALFASLIAVPALLILLPVRLLEIANPDWRLINWLHAAAVTTLTLLYLWYTGGTPWLRHFAFPILFASIAVPWVTPVEGPIVQDLMRAVAAIASEAATLSGIPTQVEGNLIRLSNGVVGVNEACSGVRSLQTSLMIGLLFGELKRLSILNRAALVAGAIAIAFIGNCARALFLVWVGASKNLGEIGHWHDFAGYSIVVAVFAGSLLLAIVLGRGKAEGGRQKSETSGQLPLFSQRSYFLLPTSCFLLVFCWLAFVEIGCEAWYRAHERNVAPLPRWTVHWPKDAPGFHEIEIDEHVRRALRYNEGHKAAWDVTSAKLGESSSSVERSAAMKCILFAFRWNPGSSSVLLARAHRPDICLPSTGWHRTSDRGIANYVVERDFSVPFWHIVFGRNDSGMIAHAFFCLQEDELHPTEPRPDLQISNRLRADWSYQSRSRVVFNGVRNLGQQAIELIFVSPKKVSDATVEAKFAELIPRLIEVENKK